VISSRRVARGRGAFRGLRRGGGALEGSAITALAEQGDPAAVELLAELGHWLGVGPGRAGSGAGPDLFVIGGGVADAGDLLLQPARRTFARRLPAAARRAAVLVPALLGNDAGMIGPAIWPVAWGRSTVMASVAPSGCSPTTCAAAR